MTATEVGNAAIYITMALIIGVLIAGLGMSLCSKLRRKKP